MCKRMDGLVLLVIVSLNTGFSIGHAEQTIRIGRRWELFVDEYVVDRMKGEVELRLHSPAAQQVIMVHDQQWEGNTSGYHTIFRDGDLCRLL
jgi:hypothetical protein